MREWRTYEDEEWERGRQPSRLGFAGLVLLLFLGGAALYRISGPPHLPASLPSKEVILYTLRGSDVPLEAFAYIFSTAAWLLWIWIVGSLVLELLVITAELVSRGAAWARSLRSISNWVTLPVVRQVVDGALVAVMVVNLVSRTVPTASAAPLPSSRITLVEPTWHDGGISGERQLHHAGYLTPDDAEEEDEEPETTYTVQAGDNLWTIAERFYGTGYEYKRLVTANVGRQMPDGRRFPPTAVIQPGWVLVIPEPSTAVERANGKTYYVVEKDDSLRGIAVRFLGDEMRWPEIFDLNQGKAQLPDGRTLKHPDLIWPGLRLEIPERVKKAEPAPKAAPATPKVEAPAREVETPAAKKAEEPRPAPTATPEPTPILAQPTPRPAEPPATPAPATTPSVELQPADPLKQETSATPQLPLYGLAGAAALAAVGGAAALRRRRSDRRSLRSLAEEPGPRISGGFAEEEFAHELALRLHDSADEPATLYAERVLSFLTDHGLDRVSLLAVRWGRNSVGFTLRAGLADRERLGEVAQELGTHLGGSVRVSANADHDTLIELAGLRAPGSPTGSALSAQPGLSLLPIGILSDRRTLYANWRAVGHVLVAGTPGGGADTILTSLVSALTAHHRPDRLRLYTIASQHALPRQILELPHQACEPVGPGDEARASAVLSALKKELLRRIERAEAEGGAKRVPTADQPNLVLVVGELADLKDEGADGGAAYDLIGRQGPEHGIRIVAASTRAHLLEDYVTVTFGTRLVLQMQHEEQSVILLGEPDAADLGGGGHLLARLEGWSAVEARGFRVSPEHLDQLLVLMREAYPVGEATREAHGGLQESAPAGSNPALTASEQLAPSETAVELPRNGRADVRVEVRADEGASAPPDTVADEEDEDDEDFDLDEADDEEDEPAARALATSGDDVVPAATADEAAPKQVGASSSEQAATGASASANLAPPDGVGSVDEAAAVGELDAAASIATEGAGNEPDPEAGPSQAAIVEREPASGELPEESALTELANEYRVASVPSSRGGGYPNGHHNGNHDGHSLDAASLEAVSARSPAPLASGTASAQGGQAATPARPALIQITCFGGPRVMSGERELSPVGAKGAQYLPWEIMVFLAAQPPEGVSREELFEAIWPRTNEELAASRLTAALVRLRTLLHEQAGEFKSDVVICERGALRHLDTELISSDVHQFVQLCRAARRLPREQATLALVQARALYRGELLAGSSYKWVHEPGDRGISPQERYQREYHRITLELAQLYIGDDQAVLAVPLYRDLLRADPTQEEVVHRLYRCYQRLGDRGALVREHRQLKQALQQLYRGDSDPGDDPDLYELAPETTALYREVLADLDARANGSSRPGS